MPHQEPEIERACVDDQPLEDILMPAQVDPAEPAGVIDMRKGPFDVLPAALHQLLSARAADPTAIAIDGLLGLGLLGPAPPAAIGLGEVGADAETPEGQQRVVAVVAPVGQHLSQGIQTDLWLLIRRFLSFPLQQGGKKCKRYKRAARLFSIRTRKPSLPIVSSLAALSARRLFHPRTPIRSFVSLVTACLQELGATALMLARLDTSPPAATAANNSGSIPSASRNDSAPALDRCQWCYALFEKALRP